MKGNAEPEIANEGRRGQAGGLLAAQEFCSFRRAKEGKGASHVQCFHGSEQRVGGG